MVQKNFGMRIGSRAQVFHGTAKQTSGGLRRSDLKKNKRGAIVSIRASARAKKENRLVKAGFITKKGKFGVVQRGGNTEILFKDIKENTSYTLLYDMSIITTSTLQEEVSNNIKSIITYYTATDNHHPSKKFYITSTNNITKLKRIKKDGKNVVDKIYI
jgi:hypothetical protein